MTAVERKHPRAPSAPVHDDAPAINPQVPAARDPGETIHLVVAMLAMFALALAPAPNSIAFILLVIVTIVRLRDTWPTYARLRHDPLGWLVIAWVAWHAITILWSNDRAQGLDELVTFRVLLLPLLLWPVMDRIVWLVGAFLLGVIVQNFVQFGQGLNLLERDPSDGDRLRGLLHPIRTASMCVTAMVWHLTATLIGRGWVRWTSLAALLIAGLGLVFTGSRGPWIAAAAALPLALVIIALRRPDARPLAIGLAIVGVIGAAATWPVAGDFVLTRVDRAMDDLEEIRDGHYRTDVGIRILSWQTALEIFADHPILGVGAGGFREAAVEEDDTGVLDARQPDHAHSLYMQVLACTGLPGILLFLAIVVIAAHRAWRAPPAHLYADGVLFVLLAWLIAACFDADHLTSHTLGIFAFLLAMLARGAPAPNPDGLPRHPRPEST